MDLSVVSGTYNRLEHLKRMVESVRQSVEGLEYEIILVDGGSTDGTIAWCKEQDDVLLIEQGELLGAIKAFNAGAYAAQGEYIAFLNDDITVDGDSLYKAVIYLQKNPHIGQIALRNNIVGTADKHRQPLSSIYGYVYGQCSVTPKWLGDLAGWWGNEGMKTYGGDSRFSLRLWELGYPTVSLKECSITDYVVEDELRKANNEDVRGPGNDHPDSKIFQSVWKDRLIEYDYWTPACVQRVLEKAANKRLKVLQFKSTMYLGDSLRTGVADALSEYGTCTIVDQTRLVHNKGRRVFQKEVYETVRQANPDLVIFQSQRQNNVTAQTVRKIRNKMPWIYLVNWDGDSHYPLTRFHYDIAKAVHLQLVISPDYFSRYRENGAHIGYWPIGVENEYLIKRNDKIRNEVVFLGSLYGIGKFPEAEMRRDAVIRLNTHLGKQFKLFGVGWKNVGLKVGTTVEQHNENAALYAQSAMSLSVSQSSDLWGYTSDRLYNITATGCTALVQRFKGMEEHGYVDGETCLAWSTLDEMVEKTEWGLSHPEQRERIGQAGQKMTWKRHTWTKRVEGLFSMIEGLTNLQTGETR